jgi:Putative restriction endonuclease
MIGKDKIDLTVDPPPDLAIEIDVTSKTQISAYQSLKVPEIWRYESKNLEINLLQGEQYIKSLTSAIFPSFPVIELIPRFVEMARTTGMSSAIRDFQEINYASCGVGNMSAPNLGRVGTPIPQENLECFFIWKSLKAY